MSLTIIQQEQLISENQSLKNQISSLTTSNENFALEIANFTKEKIAAAALPKTLGPHTYTSALNFNVFFLIPNVSFFGPLLELSDTVILTGQTNKSENGTWKVGQNCGLKQ